MSSRLRAGIRARGVFALLIAGCGASSAGADGAGSGSDLGAWQGGTDGGSGPVVYAQVGFSGCPSVSGDGGVPRCTGPAPLALTLVPLTPPGVNSVLWELSDGGVPSSSQQTSPMVTYPMPGLYAVKLSVANGVVGSAMGAAEIEVQNAATGGACTADPQCSGADACRCGLPGDAGLACPGELARGLCTRACAGGACGANQACIDLSRSAAQSPGVAGDPYRHPICLPTCATSSDCRSDFVCRVLPALADGAAAGGAFTWRKACFARVLGDVGHSCIDGSGKPSPGDCVGGSCAPLGARNLCTSLCAADPCPPDAACARFNFDSAHPFCLPRCDQAHPCTDPLLDCAPANADGWFGFTVGQGEPMGATYCAPRRCASDKDCTPAGHCTSPGGGDDGGSPAQFCTP